MERLNIKIVCLLVDTNNAWEKLWTKFELYLEQGLQPQKPTNMKHEIIGEPTGAT